MAGGSHRGDEPLQAGAYRRYRAGVVAHLQNPEHPGPPAGEGDIPVREVVRNGLRALFTEVKAVESWLRTEVADAYEELRADLSRAINSDDIRQRIAAQQSRSTNDHPS